MTDAIIITSAILLLLYDVYVYNDSIPDNTISQVMRRWMQRYPTLPFILGLLMGHWIW